MTERSEPFPPSGEVNLPPGQLSTKKGREGRFPSGRTVREESGVEGEKATIHRIAQEGLEAIPQERIEEARQFVLQTEHPIPAKETASLSRREVFERSLVPFIPIPGQAQGPFTIQERMKELDIPGVSIGVVNGGEVWTQGYGELRGRDIPTQLASIGKIFTSLTLLALIEKNPSWFPEGLDTNVVDILKKDPALGKGPEINNIYKYF